MSGRFISLEGGEGVGKSTQARRLGDALRMRGHDVLLTREPGGSDGAEAIRKLVLEGAGDRWTPGAEALLFAAARADHVHRTILPALTQGYVVISDRFLDSSIAYQGGAGGVGEEAIRQLHEVGSDGLLPHRTLLLMLAEDQAATRAADRDSAGADRIGGRDPAYHGRVAEAFRRLADAEPRRFRRIDARGTPADVTDRLIAALDDLW